jgi:cytochrome c oxidase subunit 2
MSSKPRRRLLAGLLLAAAAMLILAPAAPATTFAPQAGGSPNADHIANLYDIVAYIAIVVFVGVEGALFYALFKFRRRRGAVAAQIRGNTRLEIAWTGIPALILIGLIVLTFANLHSIRTPENSDANGYNTASSGVLYATTDQQLPPNGSSLRIQVNGQQYVWRYTYPGGSATGLGAPYAYEEMVVPTDTTVTLDIVSQDVAHSWWIPKLGGKFDAVPGYHNYTWFKIHNAGVYTGQCAELCGRLHAAMIADVRAVSPTEFDAWLAQRKADIQAANAAAAVARAKLNSQTGAASVEQP